MANSTYLSLAREQRIYPCATEPGFDSHEQTVAVFNYAVPLLWLAMFRPGDLQTQDLTIDGETLRETAPIVARKSLGKRLRVSVKLLRPVVGRVDAHVAAIVEAIATIDAAFRYVTIEWLEVAQMNDPAAFQSQVMQALRFFDGEPIDNPQALFAELCNLQHVPQYTPAELWELEESDPDQEETLAALLGTAHERSVPWEPGRPVATPLLLAVQAQDVVAVRDLLAGGADPNVRGAPQFDMPLSAAIQARHAEMIRLLLDAGADVNHPQAMPLWTAVRTQEMAIVQQLLAAGAKVDYPALRVALEGENLPLVRRFVESGIDLNPSHRQVLGQDQPLHAAQHIDIIRYLLERGADVNHPSKPLSVAAKQGNLAKLKLLLEHGANPNTRDRNGETALSCAAGCGHRACVEHLLTLSPRPEDLQTAIAAAQLAGHGEIVALLRSV